MLSFLKIRLSLEQGFTLIEVLVSLTLISIIITGVMGLFVFSARSGKSSKESLDATYTARNYMEMIYGLSQTVDFESGLDQIRTEKGFEKISPSENLFGKTVDDQYVTIQLKERGNLINVIVNVYEDTALRAKMETLLLWAE
ncbi:MAG: prepilin-type N-terminal cleavage/methylation domain-containing protein [Epulopiscium sp.]|nr:prepilin-type N-terminal cleavage/methylation domain-containing protein [Candidatus Epulonipiscium sp.]